MEKKVHIDKISFGWDHALLYYKHSKKHIISGVGSNKFGELNIKNPKYFTSEIVLVI